MDLAARLVMEFAAEYKETKEKWDDLEGYLASSMTIGQLAAAECPKEFSFHHRAAFRYLKEIAQKALANPQPFNIATAPSITHVYNDSESFRFDFRPELVNSTPHLKDVASEADARSLVGGSTPQKYKCIVVSGESGAGKTSTSTIGLPLLLFPKRDDGNRTMALYASISHNEVWSRQQEKDIATLGDDERNKMALVLLREIWKEARREVKSNCPLMTDEHWTRINAVLVLDQVGGVPNLARALVACLAQFEAEIAPAVVAGFRLVLAGAGLDWVMEARAASPIPIDPARFVHIRIRPWPPQSLRSYLETSLIPPAVDELMRISNLVALGGNARTAYFMRRIVGEKLRELPCDTVDTYIPLTVTNAYMHIFRQVAKSYANANFISGCERYKYDEIFLGSLRSAMQGTVSDKDDLARLHGSLGRGVLTYCDNKVFLSPALLLMTLGEFGRRDVPPIGPDSFGQVVALREMVKILISDPHEKARVAFCCLPEPMPPTYVATDAESFTVAVPGGVLDFKRGCLVSTCPYGVHLVVVNGTGAFAPDVFVIAPDDWDGKGKVRFIQAKLQQTWPVADKVKVFRELGAIHRGWEGEAEEEVKAKRAKQAGSASKLGEAEDEQMKPSDATRRLLQCLAAGRQVERVVVVMSSPAGKLLEAETHAEDWLSEQGGEVTVKCEVVEEMWRNLVDAGGAL